MRKDNAKTMEFVQSATAMNGRGFLSFFLCLFCFFSFTVALFFVPFSILPPFVKYHSFPKSTRSQSPSPGQHCVLLACLSFFLSTGLCVYIRRRHTCRETLWRKESSQGQKKHANSNAATQQSSKQQRNQATKAGKQQRGNARIDRKKERRRKRECKEWTICISNKVSEEK